MPLLLERQAVESWEPPKTQCSSGNRISLNWKIYFL